MPTSPLIVRGASYDPSENEKNLQISSHSCYHKAGKMTLVLAWIPTLVFRRHRHGGDCVMTKIFAS